MATNKEKLIAGAQKLVEKNQFDKAIKEYLKVVATDDKDVRIWLKIGDLYAKLGKKPEATETYQRVAQFYSEQGFYLKAVAVYKQILKLDPRLIDINQRLAELYKQLGLLSDAMSQYEQVATFFHREGKTREALSALKQIVELDPETIANRIKLAELYSQQQMVRESIEEFTRAAEQLKDAQRTDEYMRVAERLLFLSPDNRPVSKELARLYIERSDPRRALPKLQVCFKADPRDTEVLSLLARAFESLDQRQKAVSVLKELARVLGENGERQRREETFRKILSLNPGDPDAEAALSGTAGPAPRDVRPNLPPLANTASVMAIAGPQGTGARPLVGDAFPQRAPMPPEPQTAGLDMPPADEFDQDRINSAARQTAVGGLLSEKHRAVPDEEAVARILNETDVYIKYRLYAKAIEHLQRVFELDPRSVEAREKLKALYLAEGKQEEAVLELWALTDLVEPARQRRYLREILELEPDNRRAVDMLGTSGMNDLRVDAQATASETELLDDDMIEEMPVDDFEESSSGPIVLPDLAVPNSSDPNDDDLIPLVVQPAGGQTGEMDTPLEVEDRFGSIDDDEDVPPPPPPRRPPVEDDHDVRTRFDDQALHFVEATGEVDEADLPPTPKIETRSETSIEDDLDEADFFVQQNLFDEARQILQALLARHQGHPLVAAKLRDVEAAAAALSAPADATQHTTLPEEIAAQAEALAAELPEDLPGSTDAEDPDDAPPEFELTKRGVIEKGVTAEDFETHYDLGIAYKEMGLIDDAINEFRIVMKDPPREVQCHLMIGLCLLEKGQQTDAIGHFKKGLYVDGITEREALTLYFELAQAYERLKDTREALYYFEKVQKRDTRFRGVERRIEALRTGTVAGADATAATPTGDDLDAAFDGFEDR